MDDDCTLNLKFKETVAISRKTQEWKKASVWKSFIQPEILHRILSGEIE
jgi:hypothetical protein